MSGKMKGLKNTLLRKETRSQDGSSEKHPDVVLEKIHEAYLSTKEIAQIFGVQPTTLHRALCVHGHYLGLQPTKLANGRLRWSSSGAYKLLEG